MYLTAMFTIDYKEKTFKNDFNNHKKLLMLFQFTF